MGNGCCRSREEPMTYSSAILDADTPENKIKRYLKSVDNECEASHHLAIMLDDYLKRGIIPGYEHSSLIETRKHASLARYDSINPIFVLQHRSSPSINVYFCPCEKIVLFETR
jgi:hypothetical protein